MENRSFFSKIISDLKSERKTIISRGPGTIEISYPAISKQDLRNNWMQIPIGAFFCLFSIFIIVFALSSFRYIPEEMSRKPIYILSMLLPALFFMSIPIYFYRKAIRGLFLTEKLTLHNAYFIYSQGIWGKFKEILRIPKSDVLAFKFGGHPSPVLRFMSKIEDSKSNKNHLYVHYKKKKKEIMGGRTDAEYQHLCDILERYRASSDMYTLAKTIDIPNTPEEIDPPKEIEPETHRAAPLTTAAFLLIGIGILETVMLITAFKQGTSFSGGAFIYCIFGVLLLFKRRKTYLSIRKMMGVFLCLVIGGMASMVHSSVWLLLIKDPSVSYTGQLFSRINLFILSYIVSIPILVALLNHPLSRRAMNDEPAGKSWRTLYLKPKWFVVSVLVGGFFWALLTGPHIIHNPFKITVQAFRTDPKVKETVGEINSLALISHRESNWNFFSKWEIEGDKKRGTWDAILSPENDIRLDLVYSTNLDGSYPWNGTISDEPRTPEIFMPSAADGVLLSTSFENLNPDIPEDIAPLVNQNNNKWALDTRSRSGRFSVNVIPQGNKVTPMRMFSNFMDEKDGCLLSASSTDSYTPFDVSAYDTVVLEFWRYSTSNPEKRSGFNCGSALMVYYRMDNEEWNHKMSFCGQHVSENTGWRYSKLEFETKGHHTIEFKFVYDLVQLRNNPGVVYLIDDLKLAGTKR